MGPYPVRRGTTTKRSELEGTAGVGYRSVVGHDDPRRGMLRSLDFAIHLVSAEFLGAQPATDGVPRRRNNAAEDDRAARWGVHGLPRCSLFDGAGPRKAVQARDGPGDPADVGERAS